MDASRQDKSPKKEPQQQTSRQQTSQQQTSQEQTSSKRTSLSPQKLYGRSPQKESPEKNKPFEPSEKKFRGNESRRDKPSQSESLNLPGRSFQNRNIETRACPECGIRLTPSALTIHMLTLNHKKRF